MNKRKNKQGIKGCGNGAHHEVSPMGHATRTKTRAEKRQKADRYSRKAKHKGRW